MDESNRMDPRVKAMWVEALRSGKYTQGQSQLHSQDGSMCCLGVLCDLYLKEKGLSWKPAENPFRGFECDGKRDLPPKVVAEWAGLPFSNNPSLEIFGYKGVVSHHNDGAFCMKATFLDIADAIAEQL